MSEQELNDCEQMLKDLLLNDNIKRKAAEGKLASCLSSVQNKAKLVLYCSQLLLKETDLGVQMYCAIIIRKIFLPNDKANPDKVFKAITSNDNIILNIHGNNNCGKGFSFIGNKCIINPGNLYDGEFVILNLERDGKTQDWKVKNVNFKKLI